MGATPQRLAVWLLAWVLLALAGAAGLARWELGRQQELFDTNARIAHRLLSQRVVQHDAILATLALLATPSEAANRELRLPTLYPQILSIQRRDGDATWPDAALQALDAESRRLGRAVLASANLSQGQYQMLLGAEPSSYLLTIDVQRMVPWSEWPFPPDSSPVVVRLSHGTQHMLLQPGQGDAAHDALLQGWQFSARKVLAAESQPLDIIVELRVGWQALPWGGMLLWAAVVAAALLATRTLLRQRSDRVRDRELLRLGKVARLNTLGELAAGIAHELNQPLTAILANTQAADRLLAEDEPDLGPIRQALSQSAAQARRAAEVVGRLRRAVEQRGAAELPQAVSLQEVARKALYLLEPEFQRCQIDARLQAPAQPVLVVAEPVALDQVVHNLLMNAVQAMDQPGRTGRVLTVTLEAAPPRGLLRVQDTGPGIPPDALPRIFEPFYTTREGGLGLGLSLCETLVDGMGGQIRAGNASPHGAEFSVSLPLATAVP
jgi:signal transduction histidine kinase